MSEFPRLRLFLALFALCILSQGASEMARADGAEGAAGSFSYRSRTPQLRIESPAPGFFEVELEGHDSHRSALGAPDLPSRTILVAIPPGAEPRLVFETVGRRSFHPVRPAPRVKTFIAPPTAPGESPDPNVDFADKTAAVYRADPAFFAIEGTYPPQAAWLGKIGILRHQRYVEVHLAPVRYDGETEGLVVDPEIEFTVHFDGARTTTATPATDSRFEAVYREAFVNYSQGRRFRLTERDIAIEIQSAGGSTSLTTLDAGSGPRRRIRVHENGLLRLDHDFLQTHAPEFLTEPVANWKLTSQGVQVPLHVEQISGGGFDDTLIDRPGEFVQFYGQAMDLEPISQYISDDGGGTDLLYEARDFTDENVYFLTVAPAAQPTVPLRNAAPGGEPLAGPYFYDTVHEESDEFFWPYAEQDLFYSATFVTEAEPLRTDAVELPDLHATTLPITVRVQVRGAIECRYVTPDKKSGISLSNASLETLELPTTNPDNVGNVNIGIFDGNNGYTHEFDWVHEAGAPQVSSPLRVSTQIWDNPAPCGDGGATIIDDILLDWIEVVYPRSFVAEGDTLVFTWNDGAPTLFEVQGFSGPVEVYEITQLNPSSYVYDAVRLTNLQLVENGSDFTARFRMDNDPILADGTARRFVVTASATIPTPDPSRFENDRVSELLSDTTQADLLVIAHPDVIVSFCSESLGPCDTDNDCGNGDTDRCELDVTSELAELLAWRAGQGISSRVVRMTDIEDEFNHGLPGPLGIRNFISWLIAGGWDGAAPSFVMLVGDSSYDYKAGTANGTYTPTMLVLKPDDILAFYSSDNLLVDVLGEDFLPEMVVGRIPVRTPAAGDVVFEKIREYDEFPAPGSWRSNVLVMSDRGHDYDPAESLAFEAMNTDALTWLEGSPYTNQNLRFYSDYCQSPASCDIDGMHDDIIAGINGNLELGLDGAILAQFVGHGNFVLWSDSVIFCVSQEDPEHPHPRCSVDDTLSLHNDDDPDPDYKGGRLPLLLVHNCLTGGFHSDQLKSMGEQWIKRDGGGSIAVYAPSGLGFQFIGTQVIETMWGALFGSHKERDLAVPVMNTLVRLCTTNSSPETCQYHVLMGDPSMRLALPHVEPSGIPQPTAGNAQVSLSWDPSPTADVWYHVFRAVYNYTLGAPGTYDFVGSTPSTSFLDESPLNALPYVYHVVARDPAGFDSAWSNFNMDCMEDPPGDDCALAMPLNPTPPIQPVGGTTEDLTTGGKLFVSWDPNPETDLLHYTLHYGTTPDLGQTEVMDWGVSTTLHGLENDTTHYFAVTATNTSGVTSIPSELFTGVPTLILGVRAPDLVHDLTVDRAGDDALLSWGAVTLDVYGGAITIVQYEVFRGELAEFVPATENRIGATSATEFTDSGVADTVAPNYFYLVRALDGNGFPGGAGRQLPRGILDLIVTPAETPGLLSLVWPPVVTDLDQQPTQISHYELYTADQPFGRMEIEQGSVELLEDGISGNSIEISPAAQNRYYSVLAVDVRGNRSPY